jgi:hypothetical protein
MELKSKLLASKPLKTKMKIFIRKLITPNKLGPNNKMTATFKVSTLGKTNKN